MSTSVETRPPPSPAEPSRRVRRLWTIGGGIFTVAVLVFAVSQAVVQLSHEEHTEVQRFDAAGVQRIEVDSRAGSVRVVGARTDTITVTAEVSDGLQRTRHREEVEDGVLRLRARCPIFSNFCRVTYTIETPPDVDVTVRSDRGVTVADIDGAVDVEAELGLELTGLGGETLRAVTVDGRITATGLAVPYADVSTVDGSVELSFAAPPDVVHARTVDGNIDLALPDDRGTYQVDADSTAGTTATSGIRTAPDSDRTITARTVDGDVTLRYAGRPGT